MHKAILAEYSNKFKRFNNIEIQDQKKTIIMSYSDQLSSLPESFLNLSLEKLGSTKLYLPIDIINSKNQVIRTDFFYDSGADTTLMISFELFKMLNLPFPSKESFKEFCILDGQTFRIPITKIKIKIGNLIFETEALIGDTDALIIGNQLIPELFSIHMKNKSWKISPSKKLLKMLM